MKPTGKAEPRFDIDYKFGRQAELKIEELLHWIADGSKEVEVKRKRYLDLWFYVETHCDKGKRGEYLPSGINVTTAQVWAFVIGDTGLSVLFPTDLLQIMIGDSSSRDREEHDGSCPTRGKLVNLGALLYRAKQRAAALARPVSNVVAIAPEPVTGKSYPPLTDDPKSPYGRLTEDDMKETGRIVFGLTYTD